MDKETFVEEVFELAFGDEAIHKGYTYENVLEVLRKFSDDALVLEYLEVQDLNVELTEEEFHLAEKIANIRKEVLI